MKAKKRSEEKSEWVLTRGTLPSSPEAERAILGACLLDPQAYYQAAPMLTSDDFSLDAHRRIWRAMLALDRESVPIDLITMANELGQRKEVESIGGVAYLSALTDGVPVRSNIEHHCALIKEKSRKRKILHLVNDVAARAFDDKEPADKIIGRLNNGIFDVVTSSNHIQVHHVSEYGPQMFADMQRIAKQLKSGVLGRTTSIQELDELTSGMMPGEQIIIGSYSNEGKTVLAKQIVYANASRGVKCLVLTPEMTKEQYLRRMIPEATEGAFPAKLIRDYRDLDASYRAELQLAEERLLKLPLWTIDASTVTTAQLNALIRAWIQMHRRRVTSGGVRLGDAEWEHMLIVVDYVQLIAPDGEDSDYHRVTRAGEATRIIAKEEQVTTVVVSQVTTKEKGKKLPPNLGMLRQSGDLGNGAHMIFMPYRPESAAGFPTGKDQIRIAKMREGGRRPIFVELNTTLLKFVERTDDEPAAKDKPAAKKAGAGA